MDADDPEGIRGGTFSSGDLVIVGGGVARGNERRVWLALR
jgi:hypothetical protein